MSQKIVQVAFALLESEGVRLSDAISASIGMCEVERAIGMSAEEVERDGLGRFDLLAFVDVEIGYWCILAPQTPAGSGTSIWAEPQITVAALADVVRQSLPKLTF